MVGESDCLLATVAGPPTMREHFKLLPATVASGQSDSPTLREPPTAHEQWVLLHGGQGSISLEYQTYTSAYLFDTLVSGLGAGGGAEQVRAANAGNGRRGCRSK